MEGRRVGGGREAIFAPPAKAPVTASFMPKQRKLDSDEKRLVELSQDAAKSSSKFTGKSKPLTSRVFLINFITGLIGVSVLAVAFATIGANLLRTGAFVSPVTLGIVAGSGVIAAMLAVFTGNKRWAAGWMLIGASAALTVIVVTTAILTLMR